MNKPLSALAGIALLVTVGVGGALIVGPLGGEDEAVRVDTAASRTVSPESPTTIPTPAPRERRASVPGGYEFSYPFSWNQVLVSDTNPYIAKFFLTASPKLGEEELDELAVSVYENPRDLALEEFFNGEERPNLFKDAAGGFRPFSSVGATGYWFDNVLGFTNSTVVALSSDGFVYQFDDPQKHQSDGIFSRIVLSFKRVEG